MNKIPVAYCTSIELRKYSVEGSCSSSAAGRRAFKRIHQAIGLGKGVKLSFEGVLVVTPTFLNEALGQLYGHFSEADVRRSLSIVNATQEQLALLKRGVDNAKSYFASKKQAS